METILASCLYDPKLKTKFYIPRFTHRLLIADAWGITPGQRILDIGCGQGESCLVLALLVGPSGHITGIDIAQPEYGSPYTVKESHDYVRKSELGPRITFLRADTPSFLRDLHRPAREVFDSVALFHSLWYFPNPQSVYDLFRTLAVDAQAPRVYLCEYSYEISLEEQNVHALAAQTQRLFYRYRRPRAPGDLEQNVRAGLDQASILEAARGAGYRVIRDGKITPDPSFLEGHFEVQYVEGEKFMRRVKEEALTEAQEGEVLASLARLREAHEEWKRAGHETVRNLDIWWAVLEPGA
ncbi:Methyltransferase ustM [Aspergillus parasiticus]